jgi:hypothetical protein
VAAQVGGEQPGDVFLVVDDGDVRGHGSALSGRCIVAPDALAARPLAGTATGRTIARTR